MSEDELTLPVFDAQGRHVGNRLTPKGEHVLHCPTCQCTRMHPTPRVPGSPKSRSWHVDQWHADGTPVTAEPK